MEKRSIPLHHKMRLILICMGNVPLRLNYAPLASFLFALFMFIPVQQF